MSQVRLGGILLYPVLSLFLWYFEMGEGEEDKSPRSNSALAWNKGLIHQIMPLS